MFIALPSYLSAKKPHFLPFLLTTVIILSCCSLNSCSRIPVKHIAAKDYPIFTDDMDRQSLLLVTSRQLNYLESLPEDHVSIINGKHFNKKKLIKSITLFQTILQSTPNALEINAHIRQSFDVYQAGGRTDRLFAGELLATGYYEPLFEGSLQNEPPYKYPLYKRPKQLITTTEEGPEGKVLTKINRKTLIGKIQEFWTRQEIETEDHLSGQELVYLKDPFDVFLLHVQGSGRIVFPDGTIRSVRFAGHNGHPYKSIGKFMVEEGLLTLSSATIPGIRHYLAAHPEEIPKILHHNPRYIFFKWGDKQPPRGSMGVPLTAGRSIAIDREILPAEFIGYLITERPRIDSNQEILDWIPVRRFVMPQDTGSAIKGPGRVDLFFGNDIYSEISAGNLKHRAQLYFLIAKD